MKKYILVLTLIVVSYGAFAQTGLKDLKEKAEQAKNVDVDAAKKALEGKAGDKVKEVSADKLNEVKAKVADKANVDESTVEGAANMAKEAVSGKVAETAASTKAATKEKRTTELDGISGDATKVAAKNTELKAELEGKETVKTEKKATLLTKITSLGSKISSAEEKYSLLEKSGLEPEELAKKKAVIDGAKAKYTALTSSFK